jgi:hypothetical protein
MANSFFVPSATSSFAPFPCIGMSECQKSFTAFKTAEREPGRGGVFRERKSARHSRRLNRLFDGVIACSARMLLNKAVIEAPSSFTWPASRYLRGRVLNTARRTADIFPDGILFSPHPAKPAANENGPANMAVRHLIRAAK